MKGRPKLCINNTDIVVYLSQFDSSYPPPSWVLDIIAGCARLGHGHPSYPETIYSLLANSLFLTSEGVINRLNRKRECLGLSEYKESYSREVFTRVVSANRAIRHHVFMKTGKELKELIRPLL